MMWAAGVTHLSRSGIRAIRANLDALRGYPVEVGFKARMGRNYGYRVIVMPEVLTVPSRGIDARLFPTLQNLPGQNVISAYYKNKGFIEPAIGYLLHGNITEANAPNAASYFRDIEATLLIQTVTGNALGAAPFIRPLFSFHAGGISREVEGRGEMEYVKEALSLYPIRRGFNGLLGRSYENSAIRKPEAIVISHEDIDEGSFEELIWDLQNLQSNHIIDASVFHTNQEFIEPGIGSLFLDKITKINVSKAISYFKTIEATLLIVPKRSVRPVT
jgi:hypothetical protein